LAAHSQDGTTALFLTSAADVAAASRSAGATKMSTKSILIVERDLVVRHVLAHFLQNYGYRIVEADSADEACRALSTDQAPIDIALIDLQQPRESAFGLL
jgi:CheY-like chemotaxis protein